MKIKADIQAVITEFIASKKIYDEGKIVLDAQQAVYTPIYLNQLRAKMDNAFEQVVHEADAKLNGIIQKAIDKIMTRKNRRSDFNDSVSTALSYINAMGDNLTDEMALDLVQPLLGDYQTMRRFYIVLYDKLYIGEMKLPVSDYVNVFDMRGIAKESQTLFALQGYVDAVSMLKAIQVKFDGFFSKRDTLFAMELSGTSDIASAINIESVKKAFETHTLKEINIYEAHIDEIEKIYAVNAGVIA